MDEQDGTRHIHGLLYRNPQIFPHIPRERIGEAVVADYGVVIGPRSPMIRLTVTITPDGTHTVAARLEAPEVPRAAASA